MVVVEDAAAARLAEARVELEELRAEVARLRGLLGLDARRGDGHRQAWAPTLFTQLVPAAVIESTAPLDDNVALLRQLFGARSDVHAMRWENASTGKSGWSPAVRGGWSHQRAKKQYLPLSDKVLAAHLRGEVTIGVYPLLRGDTCTLLACDFDGGSWVLDALAYLDATAISVRPSLTFVPRPPGRDSPSCFRPPGRSHRSPHAPFRSRLTGTWPRRRTGRRRRSAQKSAQGPTAQPVSSTGCSPAAAIAASVNRNGRHSPALNASSPAR